MDKNLKNRDLTNFLQALAALSPLLPSEDLPRYASDHTEDLHFLPLAVVCPADTDTLSAICKLCYAHEVPFTARGAGTGLAGGALPQHGGLLISMERFNKIVDIDLNNLQVRVQAGVITQVLQDAVAEQGLYYPPDPASRGSCFIGGNINTNAGGPRALKYGVVKDYVLNLQVVLPDGQVMWTGANTLKNSTGYNLTQLFVGSEGTLGIVTEAVLKLLPLPTHRILLLAAFTSAKQACAAVSAIFRAGVTPSALEFMEREAILCAAEYVGQTQPLELHEDTQAQLLIEVDGRDADTLYADCETIVGVLTQYGVPNCLFADNQAQQDELWRLRRSMGHAVKSRSVYKEEDTVVPRAELPALLEKVKALGQLYGFQSMCYGHAGDGNLHINILRGDLSEQAWTEELPKAIRELFAYVKALGGTLSGEHGIGLVQRPYLDVVFEPHTRQLMAGIKAVFDPKNLLNPDKAI